MNILLIGEYSSVHTELSKALTKKGHRVTTISDGDGYKNFPADILIKEPPTSSVGKIIRNFSDFLGVKGFVLYLKNRKALSGLRDFDVVQIINPVAIQPFGSIANILFLRDIFKNNKKVYLAALGDDFSWVSACLRGKFNYSALDRLRLRTVVEYRYSLRYLYGLGYRALDRFVKKRCSAIIPGLLDYYLAHEGERRVCGVIPLPIDDELFVAPTAADRKIKIFHGWQVGKENKKGNDILDAAARRIVQEFGINSVEYTVAQNLPYSEYIRLFRDCDIFLDQVFSYDRGVNGALGMALGKVVFSGFERVERHQKARHVQIKKIGVNAIPDADAIAACLRELIEDRELMASIKKQAYDFASMEYRSSRVVDKYINLWNSA